MGDRMSVKESNNQKGGKSGSGTRQVSGPAASSIKSNPTKGGGINRATKGRGR